MSWYKNKYLVTNGKRKVITIAKTILRNKNPVTCFKKTSPLLKVIPKITYYPKKTKYIKLL